MKSTPKMPGSVDCPLNHALSLIGGKWRLPIIWALNRSGTLRYNELKRQLPGVTSMMLTQVLKDLETYGIVRRTQYPEIPPRVEYTLTDTGLALIPALESLARWGRLMQERPNAVEQAASVDGEPS